MSVTIANMIVEYSDIGYKSSLIYDPALSTQTYRVVGRKSKDTLTNKTLLSNTNNIGANALIINGNPYQVNGTATNGQVMKVNNGGLEFATITTNILAAAPLSITTSGTPVISLDNTSVVPGTYTLLNATISPKGRILSAANGSILVDNRTIAGNGVDIPLEVNTTNYSLSILQQQGTSTDELTSLNGQQLQERFNNIVPNGESWDSKSGIYTILLSGMYSFGMNTTFDVNVNGNRAAYIYIYRPEYDDTQILTIDIQRPIEGYQTTISGDIQMYLTPRTTIQFKVLQTCGDKLGTMNLLYLALISR